MKVTARVGSGTMSCDREDWVQLLKAHYLRSSSNSGDWPLEGVLDGVLEGDLDGVREGDLD